ncbi:MULTISPECIES: sulfite exporter TauE/SafE family protein [Methylomonas]|uniref:Heavy metal transport/detoxification protein n=2 Tax=Methylomonas TaxID=416 RepID=A0A126T5S5_9GAMM|nr:MULTISPECIES: sulfite exporter TauE/SafE family protein [Methylomonas]AMK77410.1 heavy metal transport/detoxification protein [Methylomonas denitrificans]OAI05002.1 heavy metal transport/detoxification protein [Methylomonas methanica]TCV84550.1 sulfite exporter TauE/SafE [Methylomonas methanica]
MTIINRHLTVEGMHCPACEDTISHALAELSGVIKADASYARAIVELQFDDKLIDEAELLQTIRAKGYEVVLKESPTNGKLKSLLVFVLLLLTVGGVAFWGKSLMPGVMQQITPHMDHAVLLGIGFLTGFHCIGMCGGFVVGYTDPSKAKSRQLLAHLSYAFGKTLSYSALGAGFGLLGASMAITPQMRGGPALAASVFLLLYGLKMLNFFAFLRRFTLRLPKAVNRQLAEEMRKPRSALRTGLLTGFLLGCGPLQAMYVMAAGSGDPVQGALILFWFGLGTLAPLLGFGFFASLLSPVFMRQLVKVSAILVIAMGVMMAQRGLKIVQAGEMPSAKPVRMQQSPG